MGRRVGDEARDVGWMLFVECHKLIVEHEEITGFWAESVIGNFGLVYIWNSTKNRLVLPVSSEFGIGL